MGIVTIPCTFDTANRKKDRSVRLAFTSNLEVSNSDFAELDLLVGNSGWLLWKANEIDITEIPKEDAPDSNKKPSQILRAVIYKTWELNTDQTEDSEVYYRRIMGKIIDQLKNKLE